MRVGTSHFFPVDPVNLPTVNASKLIPGRQRFLGSIIRPDPRLAFMQACQQVGAPEMVGKGKYPEVLLAGGDVYRFSLPNHFSFNASR